MHPCVPEMEPKRYTIPLHIYGYVVPLIPAVCSAKISLKLDNRFLILNSFSVLTYSVFVFDTISYITPRI